MPTYAYLCRSCGRPFEIQMSIGEKDKWNPRCQVCGSAKVEQQLFSFSVGGGGCCG
jgi:putative FmdB family regulatory protein